MIIVMRLKKRADMKEVESNATKKQHQGETYYISKQPNSSGMALFLPDSNTVVMGSEQGVKAAIERGSKPPSRPDLDFVNTNQHILFIGGSKSGSVFSSGNASRFSGAAGPTQQFSKLADEHLRYACVGLTFGKGIDVQFQGNCKNAESATKLKEEMDRILKEGRTKLTEAKQNVPAQFSDLFSLGEKVLQSASTDLNGNTVSVAATIPEDVKTVFENIQQSLPLLLAGAGSFGNQNSGIRPVTGGSPLGNLPSGTTGSPDRKISPGSSPQGFGNGKTPSSGNQRNWVVEFNFSSFTGQGSQRVAARAALSGLPGVQAPTVSVISGLKKIRCFVRGSSVDTGPMKAALEKAGFEISDSKVR